METQSTTNLETRIASLADLSAGDVLAGARACRVAADRAETDLLVWALAWADRHPVESIGDATAFHLPGAAEEIPIAGPGTPLVAEFCVAELELVKFSV